jgi:hypothetical protein
MHGEYNVKFDDTCVFYVQVDTVLSVYFSVVNTVMSMFHVKHCQYIRTLYSLCVGGSYNLDQSVAALWTTLVETDSSLFSLFSETQVSSCRSVSVYSLLDYCTSPILLHAVRASICSTVP